MPPRPKYAFPYTLPGAPKPTLNLPPDPRPTTAKPAAPRTATKAAPTSVRGRSHLMSQKQQNDAVNEQNAGRAVENVVERTEHGLRLRDQYAPRVPRFVVTHICDTVGLRVLSLSAQGRFTYAKAEDAQVMADSLMQRGPKGVPGRPSGGILSEKELKTVKVIEIPCYAGHFDPVRAVGFDP